MQSLKVTRRRCRSCTRLGRMSKLQTTMVGLPLFSRQTQKASPAYTVGNDFTIISRVGLQQTAIKVSLSKFKIAASGRLGQQPRPSIYAPHKRLSIVFNS